jgi:hypothetical protein
MYSYLFPIMKFYFGCIHLLLVQQYQYLSCDRLHMAKLDDCNILQPKKLVRSRLGGTHDLISIQNLSIS